MSLLLALALSLPVSDGYVKRKIVLDSGVAVVIRAPLLATHYETNGKKYEIYNMELLPVIGAFWGFSRVHKAHEVQK